MQGVWEAHTPPFYSPIALLIITVDWADIPPPWTDPQAETPPRADAQPPSPGRHTPQIDTHPLELEMATAVDGTHLECVLVHGLFHVL